MAVISYGPDTLEIARGSASRTLIVCLQGGKPGDLPQLAPPKYELAINRKTAGSIGAHAN
jgi:hypothetical protein